MSATNPTPQAEAKARPALRIQVGGVRIPIWKNQSEDGGVYYKAGQPELSYKGADGQWHTAQSYGPRDLINLIKATAMAHSEIQQSNHKAQAPANQEQP
jgi:hypothetical protein